MPADVISARFAAVVAGVSAHATVAINTDPAMPAMRYFATVFVLPVHELVKREHTAASTVPGATVLSFHPRTVRRKHETILRTPHPRIVMAGDVLQGKKPA
jgi:hypothetical protein